VAQDNHDSLASRPAQVQSSAHQSGPDAPPPPVGTHSHRGQRNNCRRLVETGKAKPGQITLAILPSTPASTLTLSDNHHSQESPNPLISHALLDRQPAQLPNRLLPY
jgi:hypothetical protein